MPSARAASAFSGCLAFPAAFLQVAAFIKVDIVDFAHTAALPSATCTPLTSASPVISRDSNRSRIRRSSGAKATSDRAIEKLS